MMCYLEKFGVEDKLSAKLRSIVTISALISGGNIEQLPYHIEKVKKME